MNKLFYFAELYSTNVAVKRKEGENRVGFMRGIEPAPSSLEPSATEKD